MALPGHSAPDSGESTISVRTSIRFGSFFLWFGCAAWIGDEPVAVFDRIRGLSGP